MRPNRQKSFYPAPAREKRMESYWAYIATLGSVITFLAVAPYLFGMTGLMLNTSMETADVAMLEQAVRLFVGAVLALVPLSFGGAVLFAFFQIAEEIA
jgi:hypothetical protein